MIRKTDDDTVNTIRIGIPINAAETSAAAHKRYLTKYSARLLFPLKTERFRIKLCRVPKAIPLITVSRYPHQATSAKFTGLPPSRCKSSSRMEEYENIAQHPFLHIADWIAQYFPFFLLFGGFNYIGNWLFRGTDSSFMVSRVEFFRNQRTLRCGQY